MIFVWLPTSSGKPEPQKWGSDYAPIFKGVTPLASHRLNEAQSGLSLDQLAVLYPAPKETT